MSSLVGKYAKITSTKFGATFHFPIGTLVIILQDPQRQYSAYHYDVKCTKTKIKQLVHRDNFQVGDFFANPEAVFLLHNDNTL